MEEIRNTTQNNELNMEDLEQVNGGILISTGLMAIGGFALGGSGLAFLGGYAYKTAKNIFGKKKK